VGQAVTSGFHKVDRSSINVDKPEIRRGGFIHEQSAAKKSSNKNPPSPPANNSPSTLHPTVHKFRELLLTRSIGLLMSIFIFDDRSAFFNMIGARWLTGGVGGFLFDDFVLRTRFWINPPLR
jgi:hypothetical protein